MLSSVGFKWSQRTRNSKIAYWRFFLALAWWFFWWKKSRKNKWAVWSLQLARNRIFLHEFSAQSTIIIVIYMKEAINAPIVESLLSNQDKIPSLLWVCAQWFRVSLACLPAEFVTVGWGCNYPWFLKNVPTKKQEIQWTLVVKVDFYSLVLSKCLQTVFKFSCKTNLEVFHKASNPL